MDERAWLADKAHEWNCLPDEDRLGWMAKAPRGMNGFNYWLSFQRK